MSSRRSRRLAGLPPVKPEDYKQKEEAVQYKEEVLDGGLIYTEAARLEYVWLTIIFVFILFPIYLFLANS